jgi:hypothetical protein
MVTLAEIHDVMRLMMVELMIDLYGILLMMLTRSSRGVQPFTDNWTRGVNLFLAEI